MSIFSISPYLSKGARLQTGRGRPEPAGKDFYLILGYFYRIIVPMKIFGFRVFLFFIAFTLFGQSADMDIWTEIYNGESTIQGQLLTLQMVAKQGGPDTGPFFAAALSRLLYQYPSLRRANDLASADECAMLIARELGTAKYTAAGPDLWKAAETFSNPLVKSEMVVALGRAGAADYLPHVVQLLTEMNARVPSERELQVRNSRVAYGAILSLESFRDISGYLPVFIASTGWYDSRIKNQAAASLSAITDDPTEPLIRVLQSPEYPYPVKYLALESEDASRAPDASKSRVAAIALAEGWKAATADVHQRNELARMRKLSVSMIQRYGTENDNSVYINLGRCYREGIDLNEKLDAVQALSTIGTNEAAFLLNSFILAIHQRRQSNALTREDDQLIRALISALGATRRSVGRPSLTMVQHSPAWTNTIRNLASSALENLTLQ
jgi:hypothetical protein